MNKHVRQLVLALAFLLGTFSANRAGLSQTKPDGQKAMVTGCLRQGDEVNEFSITGENGKIYQLRNSAVDLSKHVGHMVTITGTFKAEKKEGESAEYSPKEAAKAGQIQVANLKMVSDRCK